MSSIYRLRVGLHKKGPMIEESPFRSNSTRQFSSGILLELTAPRDPGTALQPRVSSVRGKSGFSKPQ